MATLTFSGEAVLELLAHAKSAPKHSAAYSIGSDPGPGLFLVKDSGIYLMSNGLPGLPPKGGGAGNRVVYAEGYEPARFVEDDGGDWDAQYDKIEQAAGGDDFALVLSAEAFNSLTPDGAVRVNLT